MTESGKIVGATILGLLVVALLLLTNIVPKETPQAPATESEVATNVTIPETKVEGVVTQDDGSVIVRDRGASFMMAPVSNKQPPVIPESAIRSRSNATN